MSLVCTLKIGGEGVKKSQSRFHILTPVCGNVHYLRYLSVYLKYWRRILAVYFGLYGRILGSIRPYSWSIRGLTPFQLGVYGDFPPSNHANILINYPPCLQLLMTLQPTTTTQGQ